MTRIHCSGAGNKHIWPLPAQNRMWRQASSRPLWVIAWYLEINDLLTIIFVMMRHCFDCASHNSCQLCSLLIVHMQFMVIWSHLRIFKESERERESVRACGVSLTLFVKLCLKLFNEEIWISTYVQDYNYFSLILAFWDLPIKHFQAIICW